MSLDLANFKPIALLIQNTNINVIANYGCNFY